MSQNWLQIDAVMEHALGVERADFLIGYPNPVLVAGEVRNGRLMRSSEKGNYGTHQYLSVMVNARDIAQSGPPVRFMPIRHHSIGDDQMIEQWMHIGRTAQSEIMINDYTISKRHARIHHSRRQNSYILEDLGSTNGTRVNGERLEKNTPVSIQTSDTIRFGRHIFTFYLARDFYDFLVEIMPNS